MREVTEEQKAEAGTAKLVGTDTDVIVANLHALLTNENGMYDQMAKAVNPYGDGTTSSQIISILKSIK